MIDELELREEKIIRIFSDPLHQEMLQALADEGAMTSAGLARVLGGEAARLHYHVRRLEGAGLIELDHEETINGIRARYMRPSAHRYRIAHRSTRKGSAIDDQIVGMVRGRMEKVIGELDSTIRHLANLPEDERRPWASWLMEGSYDLSTGEMEELQGEIAALQNKYEDKSKANRAAAGTAGTTGDEVKRRHFLATITTINPEPQR